MARLVCTADIHEHLPEIPECDLLLIAGDVSFGAKDDLVGELAFLEGPFAEWLEGVPATETVIVAGNHDQSIEAWGVPPGLRCHYLEDAGAELCGLKLWGTPWQPWFYDWAYNAPRESGERFLAEKFDLIPRGVDVVISHGPPRGYGDEGVGSTALTEAIELVQPRLVVTGHIHPGYGRYRLRDTEIVNAAYVDNDYEPVNALVEVEL